MKPLFLAGALILAAYHHAEPAVWRFPHPLPPASARSSAGSAQARVWQPPTLLTTLKYDDITESSGVANSPLWPGVYYTHNDSGDKPRFFKFDGQGKLFGAYALRGAQAFDWEDMASARVTGKSYLYFGDIGDNSAKRSAVTVYRVGEPRTSSPLIGTFETYNVTYPDGPHNAETLMVNPLNGDIYIVTKSADEGSRVFKLRRPGGSGSFRLQEIGKLTFPGSILGGQLATGGDISPDGKWIVIRTYFAAYEYAVPKRFDDWVTGSPTTIRLASETQGEAISYSRDGKALITTSEGSPCPVSVVRLWK